MSEPIIEFPKRENGPIEGTVRSCFKLFSHLKFAGANLSFRFASLSGLVS
jgi:hypothetical protein